MCANFHDMRTDLAQEQWDELLGGKSVDEQWTLITDKLRCVVNVPCVRTARSNKQRKKAAWMNDTVLSKIKRKKSAFERYKQTREGKEYLEYRRQETQKKAKPEELSKI